MNEICKNFLHPSDPVLVQAEAVNYCQAQATDTLDRNPNEFSGGQHLRIALASPDPFPEFTQPITRVGLGLEVRALKVLLNFRSFDV